MDARALVEDEWRYVVALLPDGLEDLAFSNLAIQRRRSIASAETLLRLVLAYSVCDFSLRQLAAWADASGLARISDVAALNRLRGSSDFLAALVMKWLAERGLTQQVPALPVCVVDASVVMAPGGVGVDWRLHACLDLGTMRFRSIEVTGPEGGETLARHVVEPGQVMLADRGYAHREAVAGVLEAGGHLVMRSNWQNFPLETREGSPLDLLACLETVDAGEIGDWDVQFRTSGQVYPLRLIALKKSQAAADRERKRIRYQATRKRRTPDPRSLKAAHYIYLVTDLSSERLAASDALELYRLRWQIELAFKRLKSILRLDRLRAHDPRLARTYLYGKILGALILDELCETAVAFFPWGFPLFSQPTLSLALADLSD